MSQIILASNSPRRRQLLEQIGVEFEVCPAKGEETITKKEPSEVVVELAQQKALEVASMLNEYNLSHLELTTPQDILVIGADTVVAFDGKILGKPKDEQDAKKTLAMLQGNTNEVYTGVSLVFIDKKGRAGVHNFFEKTDVTMCKMSEKEIERYVASGEPMDKAGSYGIQGKCAIYIEKINGDYNNVVGLPISKLYQELKSVGIDLYLW
ncbi:Maf family protein [Lachnobacterium bovis]|uniref:Maf family protein n=1 Tax=Lachnobacterium bovis TaxID=140626 RepID=UPI0003B37023|nr:Maf family protein [Lachnobacterium bovis]